MFLVRSPYVRKLTIISFATLVCCAGCIDHSAPIIAPIIAPLSRVGIVQPRSTCLPEYQFSSEQCRQANEDFRKSQQQEQERQAEAQRRANESARLEQQKRAAQISQAMTMEAKRGYSHIGVKDFHLDGKIFAVGKTKLAISGYYSRRNRKDERLYESFDDFMTQKIYNTQALTIGLLTENGSRKMREYFLRCPEACAVTILGYADQCVETNAFGRSASGICLVAEDMRSPGN